MLEYIDDLGQTYTQDDINTMAAEQKISADAIIKDKRLKQKPAKTTATTKPKTKKYPWSDGQEKKEPGFLDTFKKSKKANIKKSTEKVSNFVNQQNQVLPFVSEDPIQDILNPAEKFNKTLETLSKVPVKQEWETLEDKETEIVNYIKSKPIDYALIDEEYNSEINNSQTIDNIREGAKGFFNEMVLGPVSMVGQSIGADIDLTISPYKPLEKERKQAIAILSKGKKKGDKISNADIDALAKDLFYKEKILIQEGKAAEEFWDEQPLYIKEVAEQKEKLKIRSIQDVLVSSDLARQQTVLAKTYSNELSAFEKYSNDFKAKYDAGDVTDEEIAKYEVRRDNAKKAVESLKGVYDNFPKYIDKIKKDEEKLEYFKYNYDDVTANMQRLIGTSLNIIGGTGKMLGSTLEYIEGDKYGIGGLLSEASGDTIKLGDKIKEDVKEVSFSDVNSFADFGKYFSGLMFEQLPVYASMYFGGNYGAAAVSLGSGGQKIQEMEDEVGSDYDLGTKLLAGYGFAIAEFIPEKLGTLRMFDNMKRVMSTVGNQPRQIFKENFIKSSLSTMGLAGVESQIEGGTEVVTEGLDMLIDEHLLGKTISSSERSKRFKEAYAAGAFMSGGLQLGGGASTLVTKELKNYATEQEMAASKNIIDRIDFLQTEMQNNTKLSGKETDEIRLEINKLANESVKIIQNSQDRVYDMPVEDMTAVLEINKKQQDLKEEYVNLSQSNFSPEIKKEKALELKDQFSKLESEREFLLTGKYAAINKIIGNRAVINSSVENIKKIVSTLGEENINNKIGNQGSIAVFESTDELQKAYKEWLVTENNATKKAVSSGELPTNTPIKTDEEINAEVTEAVKTDGFSLPNGQSVINLSVASRTGAINVAQHEFLHKVLSKALSNPQERKKVVNGFLSVLTAKERAVVQKRIDDNYLDKETGKLSDEDLEEYFTAFIDAIAYGEIGDKNQIKDVLRRATRPILRVLQKMGFSNAKFSEGRDFYDFLKDYQSNASKGRISKRAKSLLAGEPISRTIRYSKSIEQRMDDLDAQLENNEIDYDTYETKMIALEKEEAELARKEYEEKRAEASKLVEKKAETKPVEKKPKKAKEDVEVSDVAAKAKAKLDAIGNDPKGFNANDPAIYSELDKMVKVKSRNWKTSKGTIIDLTNKDRGGLDGFSMEEMVSYVRASMIPYIAKFDPKRNNSLYGYINAQYINRMKGALRSGEVADVVFTEDVSEMTKLSNEEVEVKTPTLPERKRFQNILESGVFSPDVIENIQKKILPVVRTLKSKITEKTTLNRTVAPLIKEIMDEMGKQADIDIKKAMGGKENQELQNWLITNKKTILENMTTTWLMGKDNGKVVLGGMPFAIQKKVAGRWLNYPDWVGKKVDRESVDVDLAGRTAGHEMVRRLPEVDKNVPTIDFLSSIIDLATGNVLRGRKEALAKVLAEEVSFDIISDDIANDGIIAEALNKNQELKGAVTEKIMVEEFNRLAERGNVKFSLSNKGIDVEAAVKYMISTKGSIEAIDNALNNPSKDYNVVHFKKLYKYLINNSVTDDDIRALIAKYAVAKNVSDNKANIMYSKSLENNLDSFKGVNNIDLVSKYISDNNIKRISAEDSFDVLNDLVKELENYWGVVPDNVIPMMELTIDYAFDVIENRENEGGPLMAAVNGALNLETIKNTEVQLNKFIDKNKIKTPKFSKSLDYEFNDMLERNKNVPSYEKISDIVAKRAGKKVSRLSFFVPPSADDFRGLTTYMFSGKGKQGELDQQFFDENLVIPYVKGVNSLDSVRQSIKREYKKLLSNFPDIKKKLEKLTPDKKFTYDQAVRVYLWHKNDIDVPGLSRIDKNKLIFFVKSDPNLVTFAEALSIAGRQDGGWMKPSITWDSETIISDLHNITEGEGRKQWLSEFIENANAIFTTENLNKVQVAYGTDVRNQLEDALYRMKNGKSRPEGTDALTNKWMNWINGSTAAIMFFNVRSALLQTISSTNYLNWNDNNPLAAATAFANQKQYWTDFSKIINSDKMRERRAGLKSDVTQAEIANAANSATDKARGILSYLQKIGFTPTQAADSFSIAIGGASFYRNRVNTYLKQVDEDGNKINTEKEAEEKAWLDFSMITDRSMQSADPLYVSKQQTTALGRLVLAFANTPLQYNREIKKATLDLVNKRGDWKTNISKIIYYGALQNLLFSALQAALFLPFEEEDEEAISKMSKEQLEEYEKLKKKQDNKTAGILNGMVDTLLRGSGVTGALVSTIKNVAMEYNKQEEREMFADHAYTVLAASSISPPISAKARKLYGVHRIKKFEKDVITERGWEITRDGRLNLSPNYDIVGNVAVATTNLPLDRVVEKVNNLSEALDSRNTKIQRLALVLGWKEWELNVKNEENEKIKTEAKAKRKAEGIEKGIITREEKRKAEKKALMEMDPKERLEFRRKKALEKREKLLKKRKRKMGGD